jgi:hypothetical protein
MRPTADADKIPKSQTGECSREPQGGQGCHRGHHKKPHLEAFKEISERHSLCATIPLVTKPHAVASQAL